MAGLIAVWALFGLRISRAAMPLLVLLVTFNIGGMISMTQMADLANTPLYLAVSLFLAFTAVFFASVTAVQPSLYRLIFFAYVVSAVLTSLLGIAGYFHAFPGAEIFTKYDRAAGAFQDPNVFGPFLVLPGIYLLYLLLTGPIARMPLLAVPLLIITAGIFFSFSRGAWGMFAVSAILLTGGLFLQSASGMFRLRVVVMTIAAIALLVIAMIVILQLPGVSEMFSSRAQLEQSYDSARLGRFARYAIGFQMALEHPLGIGPLVFGTIFGEDTHDIWLKTLMDYGWLGFVSFLALIVLDDRRRLPHPAARPAVAALSPVRLCRLHRQYRARHLHRHRPLAPPLSAARPDLGRHRAGIPPPAAVATGGAAGRQRGQFHQARKPPNSVDPNRVITIHRDRSGV